MVSYENESGAAGSARPKPGPEAGPGPGPDVRLPLWILRTFGMWGPRRGWAAAAYRLYTTAVVTSFFLGLVTFSGGAVANVANGPVFSHIVCLLGQCCSATGKAVDFLRQRGRVRRLLAAARALPQPAPGSAGAAAMARASREGNTVAVAYTATGFVAYVLWHAYPVVHGNAAASARCQRLFDAAAAPNATHGDCHARILPTEAWSPFDARSGGWGYAAAYLFQMEWIFYAYIITSSLDCLYVSLMLHVAAHGRALAERMRTVRDVEQLHDCVRYHQRLIVSVNETQTVVGNGALMQFLSSLGVICLALYNVSKVNALISKSQFGVFFVTMSGEVLLYCWYGEEVASSSEEVARAVYECPWPDAPLRMRRALLTVLMRSQRTLRMRTAGGFKTLSRETYLALIQTSYSLYTVLVSMDE